MERSEKTSLFPFHIPVDSVGRATVFRQLSLSLLPTHARLPPGLVLTFLLLFLHLLHPSSHPRHSSRPPPFQIRTLRRRRRLLLRLHPFPPCHGPCLQPHRPTPRLRRLLLPHHPRYTLHLPCLFRLLLNFLLLLCRKHMNRGGLTPTILQFLLYQETLVISEEQRIEWKRRMRGGRRREIVVKSVFHSPRVVQNLYK